MGVVGVVVVPFMQNIDLHLLLLIPVLRDDTESAHGCDFFEPFVVFERRAFRVLCPVAGPTRGRRLVSPLARQLVVEKRHGLAVLVCLPHSKLGNVVVVAVVQQSRRRRRVHHSQVPVGGLACGRRTSTCCCHALGLRGWTCYRGGGERVRMCPAAPHTPCLEIFVFPLILAFLFRILHEVADPHTSRSIQGKSACDLFRETLNGHPVLVRWLRELLRLLAVLSLFGFRGALPFCQNREVCCFRIVR
mmetsp:Transcript_46253/g.77114  ORF Transcript_46253/g.77114 Transcript_46253/m.77114 type:complete len:247 (+) Transcript_46253:359-1099(+)